MNTKEQALQKPLMVRAKRNLKNSFTATKRGAIGYVSNGNYFRAPYNNNQLYVTDVFFPKTRGDKWSTIGLINEPAEKNVEIIKEINELPNFIYLGKNIYLKG